MGNLPQLIENRWVKNFRDVLQRNSSNGGYGFPSLATLAGRFFLTLEGATDNVLFSELRSIL